MDKASIIDIYKKLVPNKIMNKDVVIYGTGTLAKEVHQVLINREYQIQFFLNKDLNHPNCVGDLCEIRKLNDKRITQKMKHETTVVLAVFNPYASVNTIVNDLINSGYNDIVTFPELIEIFKGGFNEIFYLNKTEDFIKDLDKIVEFGKLLNDSKSKELYEEIVKFRITKKYEDLTLKDSIENQYFPEDVGNLYSSKKIRFIDCGGFDGDTVNRLCNNIGQLDAVSAFEPDLFNYNRMLKSLNKLKLENKLNEISAFPCAIFSKAVQMNFNMNNAGSSSISESGSTMVQCVAIDECIRDFKPTNIKMDIEGAEYGALLGAKNTIMKYKPNLAICVYHRPTDIYKIPLLINSWSLGYKLYLRMYGNSGFDLVLYAILQ